MVEIMHDILLDSTKITFCFVSFIVVFANEVTTINNTQWLFIHMYVIEQWKRILILLCVQLMGMLATTDNIFSLMLKCLVEYGGLGLEELVGKLISIKCDGNNMFQGHKS
jgi:hypothetical protein